MKCLETIFDEIIGYLLADRQWSLIIIFFPYLLDNETLKKP